MSTSFDKPLTIQQLVPAEVFLLPAIDNCEPARIIRYKKADRQYMEVQALDGPDTWETYKEIACPGQEYCSVNESSMFWTVYSHAVKELESEQVQYEVTLYWDLLEQEYR